MFYTVMLHSNFAEAQLGPLFMAETGLARAEHNLLSARYAAAVDTIVDPVITNPMHVTKTPDKDLDMREAVLWRMDGQALDGTFDFAIRIAARVYTGSEHRLPAKPLTETRRMPSRRWEKLAGELGSTGLYAVGLEVREAPLQPMEPRETIYDARNYAKFIATFLGAEEVRLKADPTAREPLSFGPFRSFDDVLGSTWRSFVGKHAENIVDSDSGRGFAEAAAKDHRNPNFSGDSLTRYRQESQGVHDIKERIHSLAQALYAANDNGAAVELLAQLLAPHITQIANLARLDSSKYYAEKSQQPGKETLYHRLGWVCDQAVHIQTLAYEHLRPDVDGFRQTLHDQLQPLERIVRGIEDLQAYLEPPATIAMEPPGWRVHPL